MKRWLFTALSFAAVLGVSIYAVQAEAPAGVASLLIPWYAHVLAFLGFAIEAGSRAFKLTWSAKAVGARLPFRTSLRVCLGGDFGASITPARMGAEPARYLILAESGMSIPDAMVVMYTELFFEMISLAAVVWVIVVFFDASPTARLALTGIVGIYSATILGLGALGLFLSWNHVTDTPPAWAAALRITGGKWAFVRRWVDRIRGTVEAFKRMKFRWGAASLASSIVHVGIRFTILPAIVYSMTTGIVPLAPLVVWPFTFIYGAGVLPAPGGGGAVEFAFHTTLGDTIPAAAFAASLVWWRFYTFYLYIALGALVAGNTVLRAIRETQDAEEEFERA